MSSEENEFDLEQLNEFLKEELDEIQKKLGIILKSMKIT